MAAAADGSGGGGGGGGGDRRPSGDGHPSAPARHDSTVSSASSSGGGGSSRRRNTPFFDVLCYSATGARAESIAAARRVRIPFIFTPNDREVARLSRSGRQLSELEILQEKHDPEFRQIVPMVADALSSITVQHASLARQATRDEKFALYETHTVPGIQIEDYVQRIAEYTYISPTTMIVAMILLDRLIDRHPSLLVTQLNVFKLFFVSVRVASKVNDLRTLNNKHFASVGGISNRHLNDLEARFLIDSLFDLFVSPRELAVYARKVLPPDVPRSLPLRRHGAAAASGSQEAPSSPAAGAESSPRSPPAPRRDSSGTTSTAPPA